MKILRFEKYQAHDNTDRYKTVFEEDDIPLITATKPAFQEGDDIPENNLRLVEKDGYSYRVWKAGVTLDQKRGFQASPEKIASFEGQAVFKAIVDIFIAGKIEEFETSKNPYIMGIRNYAERRLVQDHPIIEEMLEIHPGKVSTVNISKKSAEAK